MDKPADAAPGASDPVTPGSGIVSAPRARAGGGGRSRLHDLEISEIPAATGFWSGTPGAHRMARDRRTWEQFLLLEGEIELTPEGGATVRHGAGAAVTIPAGFTGIWRTLSPVRKYDVTLAL